MTQAHQHPAAEFDTLNLGCGIDHRPDAWDVDAVASVDPDEVVDLTERPWPWPDACFERIVAAHVLEHLPDIAAALRECRRILSSGGELVATLPVGVDARADPDHYHVWTWRTPTFYCGERHWDVDVGLDVVDRDVELWTMLPEGRLRGAHERLLGWLLDRYDAGPWCFAMPATAGEFRVVFRNP